MVIDDLEYINYDLHIEYIHHKLNTSILQTIIYIAAYDSTSSLAKVPICFSPLPLGFFRQVFLKSSRIMMHLAVAPSKQIMRYETSLECIGNGGVQVDDLSNCLLSPQVQLYVRSDRMNPNY